MFQNRKVKNRMTAVNTSTISFIYKGFKFANSRLKIPERGSGGGTGVSFWVFLNDFAG
jgi:hypothetical protein